MDEKLKITEKELKARWRIRRKIIVYTLAFCGACLAYLLIGGTDSRLHETIATGVMAMATAIITSYIAGSVFDDKNMKKKDV